MSIPRATVRLQFGPGFTLEDAAAQVEYYAALGISHFYTSPLQTAQPGSSHGYDIIDPDTINPALGGEAALQRLAARLHAAGMGLILDIVPNHMGIGSCNPWWQHVLEWGRDSRYAEWFDIDWNSPDPLLHGKVLLPLLACAYGTVLQAGDITLHFDPEDGRIFLRYQKQRLPICVMDYADILRGARSTRSSAPLLLAPAIAAFARIHVDPEPQQQAERACSTLRHLSRTPAAMAAITAALSACAAQAPQYLHDLLQRQHYRLTCWRNAAEEINWRRFFEVSELAGLRVEIPQVFEASHALVLRLCASGLIDGVRVDHIDGLADPGAYCRHLRQRLQSAAQDSGRPPAARPYLVVEKILTPQERLRSDWGVDGTTGYEFMDQVGALLHEPNGMDQLTALWQEWTGQLDGYNAEIQRARQQLLSENLRSECHTLVRSLLQVARSEMASHDCPCSAINRVVIAILLHFPRYRTYVDAMASPGDARRCFAQTEDLARQTLAATDHALLTRIIAWLSTPHAAVAHASADAPALRLSSAMRFQQFTPVLTAKSGEDTAFYRYGRLVSRNEVGSDPEQGSLSLADFHQHCRERFQNTPHTLLSTATHDHKRGEDLRARLAVLSEQAPGWAATVWRWRGQNGAAANGPEPADELMLYQMLVGAWPMTLQPEDRPGMQQFASRIGAWQTKSLREAKKRSNWQDPALSYEARCQDFLLRILADQRFLTELTDWVQGIAPAGVINSLSQTLLRMTSPGVPDLYQGRELWDFSLVDPDNRGAVDYTLRQQLLQMQRDIVTSLSDWRSGEIKLRVIQRTLALRQQAANLFAQGDYQPLSVTGAHAQHIVAFLRRWRGAASLTVSLRWPSTLLAAADLPLITAATWQDTAILLPHDTHPAWSNQLTQQPLISHHGQLPVCLVLAQLPVALLYQSP
jgi:(1->4)-alpha-D-glucan 1-alpha-D-glucosylmutase